MTARTFPGMPTAWRNPEPGASSPGVDPPADSVVEDRTGGAASSAGLRTLLREDRDRHYGSLTHPGFHVLLVYRLARWSMATGGPAGRVVGLLCKAVNNLVIRNLYGAEVSPQAVIGRRVLIGHHQAVQIPPFSVVGDDCILRHNVTIGLAGSASPRTAVPHIGRGVEIGSGACLLGPITIGDRAKIGPGALVTVDLPSESTAFAQPARVMRPRPPVATPEPRSDRNGQTHTDRRDEEQES